MKTQFENKEVKKDKKVEVKKEKYFFSDRQITVEASSMEEAQKELQKIIDKNN